MAPPRVLWLQLLLLVFLLSVFGTGGDSPAWWRLTCNQSTTVAWHLCDLTFFADSGCSRALPGQIAQRIHSAAQTKREGTASVAFAEWASHCSSCGPRESYVGAGFDAPVIVQCVRFSACLVPTPLPTRAPTHTPTRSPTPTLAAGGSGSSGATQPPTPSPNPSDLEDELKDQLGGLDDLDALLGGGRRLRVRSDIREAERLRRLAGLSGASADSCKEVVLQRSDVGVVWRDVASWKTPKAGQALPLIGANFRAQSVGPGLVSRTPTGDHGCGSCAGQGVRKKDLLELTFDRTVFRGLGGALVQRGGGLSSLTVPMTDEAWFKFAGQKLQIVPQAELGAAASCTTIKFDADAIVDADGMYHAAGSGSFFDTQAQGLKGYGICIKDEQPPSLTGTDPPSGTSVKVGLTPRLLLIFDEAIAIAPNPPAAAVVPTVSRVPHNEALVGFTLDLTSSEVQTVSRNVVIDIPKTLLEGTTYELRIPAGAIVDGYGNAWTGGILQFTTASTYVPPTLGPTVSGVDDTDVDTGTGGLAPMSVVLGSLGILCAVAVCGGTGLFALKWWLQRDREEESWEPYRGNPPVEKIAPQPAPTARSPGAYASAGSPSSKASAGASPDANAAGRSAGGDGSGPREAGRAGNVNGSGVAGAGSAGANTFASTAPSGGWRAGAQSRAPPRKAREAEDVSSGGWRTGTGPGATGGAAGARFRRQGSSNVADDSDVGGGGWVRSVDQATGRPYWYHNKTLETRWDPPPRGSADSSPSAGPQPKAQPKATFNNPPRPKKAHGDWHAGQQQQQQQQQQQAPPSPGQVPGQVAAESPGESEEVGRVKADIYTQLDQTCKEDIASRKKTFKFMCLKWHPDKNQENQELATAIFQFIQAQRDWYLKE
eukprot:TRINITY_DN21500_c0_g1_i1.p1 TRINITY_DN21500_c0_g1~~TRINITY_DN21500_c0_g1_i1.p1  ORF type:complete len:882 (+),score=162.81 TRINITY_DN21500_c0_g1_i1:179-2824(+)